MSVGRELAHTSSKQALAATHSVGRSGAEPLYLYHTEEMLWANQQLYPEAATFHISIGLRAKGALDRASLQKATELMATRHEVFRTTFRTHLGRPERRIRHALPVELEWTTVASERDAVATLQSHCRRPFDLETGPLWRVCVAEMNAEHSLILLVVHHIIFDEASIEPFVMELLGIYDAIATKQPVPASEPRQFVEYIACKRALSTREASEANWRYWEDRLTSMERLIELPFYRCANDERRFRGGRFRVPITPEAAATVDRYTVASGASREHVLLAAFNALLYRYFGADDISLISPADDRAALGFVGVFGFAGNLLPLRTHLKRDQTFGSLVNQVRKERADGWEHRDIPFNDLVQILRGAEGHVTEAPFTVMFENKEEPLSTVSAGGVSFSPRPIDNGLAKMPLSLTALGRGSATEFEWEFNAHVFDLHTIEELAAHYTPLLADLCKRPDARLDEFHLPTAPRRVLGNRPVSTAQAYRQFTKAEVECSLVHRFWQQVDRLPSKVAIASETQRYTYAELDRAACRLARRLIRVAGVGPKRVALCFDHEASFMVGVFGTLMACGAYVPLDLGFPQVRLERLLEDADVAAIVCSEATKELATQLAASAGVPAIELGEVLCAPGEDFRLERAPAADDLAYIIYTSGSTGTPKGVMQSHRNVLHHIRAWTNSLRLTEYDHHTLFSAYSWDSAVQDIYGALLNGATLFPRNLRETDMGGLADWLRRNAISVIHTTVPFYRRFVKSLSKDSVIEGVRAIAIGGEAVRREDLDHFKTHFASHTSLVNMYGATESSSALFYVANHETELDGEVVPLGFPPADTEVVLVRNGVEQRAHSIVGEIAIKSEFLATGYWGGNSEANSRFKNLDDGTPRRMYMTGDLGRVLHDGAIEYVGRRDFQVKVRGFRIGLGEIESFIGQHPLVRDVVVIASHELGDETELVAYYSAKAGVEAPGPQEIREYLLERVPDYMVPRFVMLLDAIPLTPRGKIDRDALPKPSAAKMQPRERSRDYMEARDQVELDLVGIWESVLAVSPVGVRDNFFALGGHSMLGFQMLDQVKCKMGVTIPPVALYRGAATVELLAIKLKSVLASSSEPVTA